MRRGRASSDPDLRLTACKQVVAAASRVCGCRPRPAQRQGVHQWPKVLAVLYDDPVDGYPKSYARDDIPKIDHYPDGQTTPSAERDRLQTGRACSAACPASWACANSSEKAGHTLVVTSDKDGAELGPSRRSLPDAEIVISQPFWPAYMTKERIDKAKKLKLIITAGIGSDHTDLQAAMDQAASPSPRSPIPTRSASPSTS